MSTTADKILVMQAFERGDTIQVCIKDTQPRPWGFFDKEDVTDPAWNWEDNEYRIKPEPKVIWVNEYGDGDMFGYEDEGKAKGRSGSGHSRKGIKYIEVIED